MSILLVGMNHRTAPVNVRERLSFVCGDETVSLQKIRQEIPEVEETLLLATCNRVEILANVRNAETAVEKLRAFIVSRCSLPSREVEGCLYIFHGDEAVRHLLRVAASLDSMIMGEPQILGQVKEAYRVSVEQKVSGVIFHKLLHHAFRVAKRVRTETMIAHNAVSVSFAAVELAKKIFGDLYEKSVLVIGAGEMAELAVKHLINNGVSNIVIANRTYANALKLANHFHGEAVHFEQLPDKLKDVDIIISSTGAPGYIISGDMVMAGLRRRKNRLLFLIDIAVPRDIEPVVAKIDNVYLYDIDNLQEIVDENIHNRMQEAEKAESIIDEEVVGFTRWLGTLDVIPTIVALRQKAEEIVQKELAKAFSWMSTFDDDKKKNIEILINSVLNKMLHDPITSLKEETLNGDLNTSIAVVKRLFRLDEDSV